MSRITNREELLIGINFHPKGAAAPKLMVHGFQPGITIDIGEQDGMAILKIDSTGPDTREDLSGFLHMVADAILDGEPRN